MDIQPRGSKIFEDMAIIAAYFDFITKMEKVAMSDFTVTHSDNWKTYGLKRSLLPY